MGSCPFYRTMDGYTMTRMTHPEAIRMVEEMGKSTKNALIFSIVVLGMFIVDLLQDQFYWYLSTDTAHIPISVLCALIALLGFTYTTRNIENRKIVAIFSVGTLVISFLLIYGMLTILSIGWAKIHGGINVDPKMFFGIGN